MNAEVIEDVGTMATRDALVRARATRTEDVIAQLEGLAAQGRLPLVWSVDWGAAYRSRRMASWLEAHAVALLPSLPHTPQHNPWVERKHRDVKAVSGLGRGVALASVAEAQRRWAEALDVVDGRRLRARLGCRTAAAIDRSLPSWEGEIDRRAFYEAVRRARAQAVLGLSGVRARRLAERAAVFEVLEQYGLARRTRGGAPLTPDEAEGIS